jgi:hypothetical protein
MNAENKIGRPLKFKTPKKLEQRITEYFESCFETKWEDELQRDEDGNKLKDETGAWVYKPVRKKVLVKPMSITGLAIALDTSRRTLLDYSEKDGYSHSIKKALEYCHNFVEDGLLNGKINAAAGIFNLKNNYGWKDETEQKIKVDNITKVEFEVKKNDSPTTIDAGVGEEPALLPGPVETDNPQPGGDGQQQVLQPGADVRVDDDPGTKRPDNNLPQDVSIA